MLEHFPQFVFLQKQRFLDKSTAKLLEINLTSFVWIRNREYALALCLRFPSVHTADFYHTFRYLLVIEVSVTVSIDLLEHFSQPFLLSVWHQILNHHLYRSLLQL